MKAPDKIYLTSTSYRILDGWCESGVPLSDGMEHIEYIHKDALLEWLEEMKFYSDDNRKIAYQNVIDKIHKL